MPMSLAAKTQLRSGSAGTEKGCVFGLCKGQIWVEDQVNVAGPSQR